MAKNAALNAYCGMGIGLGMLAVRVKMRSAKRVNVLRGVQGMSVWQRNYDEHVIRNEEGRQQYCECITLNPGRWAEDHEYPARCR